MFCTQTTRVSLRLGLSTGSRCPATPSRFEPWTFLWEGPLRFPTAAASWGSTASGPIRARNQPNRTRPGGSSSSSTIQLDVAGAVAKGVSGMYQTNFGDANVQNELYSFSMPDIHVPVPNYITSGHTTALATYLAYVSAAQNPSDTTWQT